jgi:hypothetical protein
MFPTGKIGEIGMANNRKTFAERALEFPEVPLGQAIRKPGLYHLIYQHDDGCVVLAGAPASACNCDPTVSLHKHPENQKG